MQNPQTDAYARRLETLITDVLLPGYIKYCRSNNLEPQLQKIPKELLPDSKQIPALLKPF
jgi:hypothetical protein